MSLNDKPSTELIEIPGGKEGTGETVKLMVAFAIKASRDFEFITKARRILHINNVNPRDERAIADTMFYWVKKNITFMRDPATAEMVQYPMTTIKAKHGDCDDQTALLAALNLSVGNKVRYITIGRNKESFRHVYLDVQDAKGNWISYDTVVKKATPGWSGNKYVIKRAWYFNGKFEELADYIRTEYAPKNKSKITFTQSKPQPALPAQHGKVAIKQAQTQKAIRKEEKAAEEAEETDFINEMFENPKRGLRYMHEYEPAVSDEQVRQEALNIDERSSVIDESEFERNVRLEDALIDELNEQDEEIRQAYGFLSIEKEEHNVE